MVLSAAAEDANKSTLKKTKAKNFLLRVNFSRQFSLVACLGSTLMPQKLYIEAMAAKISHWP
jgi:hypothetical protein